MNEYLKLKERQSEELDDFPIFWAFNTEQFEEGMAKLNLNKTDTKKIVSLGGGGYLKKIDAKALKDLFTRQRAEKNEAIKNDTTGEGFIFDMFDYELSDHEFIITMSVEDTLDSLSLSVKDINENPALLAGLNKAIASQYENQEN